jgi:hypothetical protein
LGFETLVTAEPSAPTLEVTAQSLRYEVARLANFSGTITVKIYKDTTVLYEKSYDNSREHGYTHLRASDRSWFEENFNAVLSDLVGQLLTDVELLKALR